VHNHLRGAAQRTERDVALARSTAWHVATLSRARKIPPHDEVVGHAPPPRRQTADQITASGMALAAAWGAPADPLAVKETKE